MSSIDLPEAGDRHQFQGELERVYELRFREVQRYRNDVLKILVQEFFQPMIPHRARILDLGCGWGEFINHARADLKFGMDLNPETRQRLAPDVQFLEQDCSKEWPLPNDSLDLVFTSNFFEHLRGKTELRDALRQVRRCLKPGGKLVCIGPNIRHLAGAYWDFWDHYLPLSDKSLQEVLELLGFRVERSVAKFLPYQMVRRRPVPLALVRLYLKLSWIWPFFGKQFLYCG
jgi:SAM-dependent methyltransferase